MKQEDRDLLLKDLCARLPYGVKVKNIEEENIVGEVFAINRNKKTNNIVVSYYLSDDCDTLSCTQIEFVRPYLRPMSSMTEEEINTLKSYIDDPYEQIAFFEDGMRVNGRNSFVVPYKVMSICIDFCNSHHLDFNGLIEKGLALEADEGIY